MTAGRPTLAGDQGSSAGRSPRINFRLPAKLYTEVKRLADERGISTSQLARQALVRELFAAQGHVNNKNIDASTRPDA